MSQRNSAANTLDFFAIVFLFFGGLLLSGYAVIFIQGKTGPADIFMVKLGGIFLLPAIALLSFRVPAWIRSYREEKAKVDEIAAIINPEKISGLFFNGYLSITGVSGGVRYKITHRKRQYNRGVSAPSKLFIYLFLNRAKRSKFYMIRKDNWYKQGILNVLTMMRTKTGIPEVDEGYIVRSNDKEKAMQYLADDSKRKLLLSFCGAGFEVEINKNHLYLGRESLACNSDISLEKDSIAEIVSMAPELYEKFSL